MAQDVRTDRLTRFAKNASRFSSKIGALGTVTMTGFPRIVAYIARHSSLRFDGAYLPVLLRHYPGIVWMRYGSSDYDVMRQIFVVEEFQCILHDLDEPKYILDCGANAGYASLYFLRHFPSATVCAIEPEEGNVRLCEENLKQYGDRVSVIKAGVWSHDADLTVEKGVHADGRDWATRVRAAAQGERVDVRGVNIGTVLDKSGFDYIDLLKVDIENAEGVVFGANFEQWLPRVKNIVIELHDDECRRSFFAALEDYEYDLSRQGNLTICKGLRSKKPPPVGHR